MHVTDLASLKAAVFDAWSQILGQLLQELATSMNTRLGKVEALHGGYTGY
jgi:hypothetical protein